MPRRAQKAPAKQKPPRDIARPLLCPSLPPELWIHILSYHTDLTHLWSTCRRVSSSFRAYTEHVFAAYHLKDTWIDWYLEKYNLGDKSRRPEMYTSFHGFSEDRGKRLVYFRDKRSTFEVCRPPGSRARKIPGATYKVHMHGWEENVKNTKPEMPNYSIRIAGMLNDTALPNLSVNVKDQEISFDWRGMFQAFFREQERLRYMKKRWKSKPKKPPETELDLLLRGDRPPDPPKKWRTVQAEYRKLIRRARLKEHYADDDAMCWAIDSLAYYDSLNDQTDGNRQRWIHQVPGAGLGERWVGAMWLLEGMYLDEMSCWHRMETKAEHLAKQGWRWVDV